MQVLTGLAITLGVQINMALSVTGMEHALVCQLPSTGRQRKSPRIRPLSGHLYFLSHSGHADWNLPPQGGLEKLKALFLPDWPQKPRTVILISSVFLCGC